MPSNGIPSDREQLLKHRDCISHRAHSTRCIVSPGDGYFADPVAEALRKVEELDVEGPPVDALPPKQVLSRSLPECLKAALRILESSDGEKMNDGVKHTAHDVPPSWLPDSSGAGCFARPNGNIRTRFNGISKEPDLLDRHGKVSVA
jgi:hypothetical protein